MRFLSSDMPSKMFENVTSYVSTFMPTKLPNGVTKLDYTKSSHSNGVYQNGTANGTILKTKKGAILDGAIEKRLFPVEFEWNGPGDRVMITGSFYDWTVKIPLSKKSDKFYAKIDLPKGQHEFKFLVNGVWKSSLRYPTVTNGFGDFNNVIQV